MAHAKKADLEDLRVLLGEMRNLPSLKEKSYGCFYYKSKGVLHFHVKDGHRYAHVSNGKMWHEIDLPARASISSQRKIFLAIKKIMNLN